MKKSLLVLLAAATLGMFTPVFAADNNKPSALPGHYYLEGVTEVGSELLLKEDGSFEWMLAYGSLDQMASGSWSASGDAVTLVTSAPTGPEPTFTSFSERDLKALSTESMREDGQWMVLVGIPQAGAMADVEVTFVAKSGKTASAVTSEQGDASVSMPATETWTRVGLRRKGGKADVQWIDMPPDRASGRVAAFQVSDPKWVIRQAFQRMMLSVVPGGLKVSDPSSGLGRGEYVMHPKN